MYRIVTLTLGFFLLASAALAQEEASFQRLGDLPGGDFESMAVGMSADGSVVVGVGHSAEGHEAFRWEDGVMEGLGDLEEGEFFSFGRGASADGSVVVGGGRSAQGSEAWRWEDGIMEGLGDIEGGPSSSGATDVSADGSVVVGGGQSAEGIEAYRWEDGIMERLGVLPGNIHNSSAAAVSADGSVVVGYSFREIGVREAFRWEDGVMEGLGYLQGGISRSHARAVSADGSVVVGSSGSANSHAEAFRWEDGIMEGLGDLEGGEFESQAYGVSADGSIVVGYSDSASGHEAFLWTSENGMRSVKEILENDYGLNLTGWTLGVGPSGSGVGGIGFSADGTVIAGIGINPDGDEEAWRAVIPPPPPAPANDNIADATVIPTDGDTYEGSNVSATLEEDEPEPSCTFSNWTTNFSVWWSFTPEDDGLATINTNGSITPGGDDLDTILSLHNVSDLSEVACDDNGGDGVQSLIEEVPISEGEIYLIRVAGYNENSVNRGDIQLTTDFQFGVSDETTPEGIAEGLSLVSPNPAQGSASLILRVAEAQEVVVEVFDATGRRVQALLEGALTAGELETLTLDASALPAGVYAIRATGENFVETRRVTVVR